MKILIAGCGKIGITLLASLVAEGHDVTAIDICQETLDEITNIYDVIGVCGNATEYETLVEAGTAHADLFVCTLASDEQNMLSCYLARQLGASQTIARVRNPEYSERALGFMKDQLGLSMTINPDRLAAQELYHILRLPSAVKIETFSRRNFEMIEMILREDSPLAGLPLSALRSRYAAKFLICVVQRGDQVYIPDGNFVLQGGDKIGLTATPTEFQKLLRGMGVANKQARDVMLLGGSRIAVYLAKMLQAAGSDVRIIEKDEAVCDELCENLPRAVIIHGDGAQQELLLEEGLESMDAFVSLTGMDEQNILLSFFAASHKVPKVISKVSRDEFGALAQRLGLECVVSPRQIIADVLVQYARALQNSMGSNVETLYKLMDGSAEAVEFNVREDARPVGVPLKELSLKSGILIAGILRDRQAIIPDGDEAIRAGDKVVIIAANRRLQDLDDIIR
ncbi:MAG: Trk system potassium transporter TrkA [Clostridia bacterium]|nr:Trk system potassium transporter TrkA [Clostridia bacterium]